MGDIQATNTSHGDDGESTNTDSDTVQSQQRYVAIVHTTTSKELETQIADVLNKAAELIGDDGPDPYYVSHVSSNIPDEESVEPPLQMPGGAIWWGTTWNDNERDDIDDVLDKAAEIGTFEHILINNMDALGLSLDEIQPRLERIGENEWNLHLVEGGVTVERDAAGTVAATIDELDRCGPRIKRRTQTRDLQRRGLPEEHHGRPPLGFAIDETGRPAPADNHDEVCAVLSAVQEGEITKTAAADKLGCSPRTVTRAIKEHPNRYGLESSA